MSKETPRKDSSRSSSVTPRFVSPYAFTKTGVAGEQRESMLQSELQTLVCHDKKQSISFSLLRFSRNWVKYIDVVIKFLHRILHME